MSIQDENDLLTLAKRLDGVLKNFTDEEVEMIITTLRHIRRLRDLRR